MSWLGLAALLFSGVGAAEPPTAATPAEPEPASQACVDHHEQAQLEQRADHLLAAREHLRACLASDCPEVVRIDCSRWFPEVEATIPSIVVSLRRNGNDVPGGQLFLDGRAQATGLEGRELELDPGSHDLTVTLPGEAPQERHLLVSKGDKARLVLFELPAALLPVAEPEPQPPARPATVRPVGTWTYVLGGVSLVALGGFAVLGGAGLAERNELASTCAPFCEDAPIQSASNLLLAADISLAVALLSGTAATLTYVFRPEVETPPAAATAVRPRLTGKADAHGVWISATGTF